MNLSRNVSAIIREHVTLQVASIDLLYLNLVARLQHDPGWLSLIHFGLVSFAGLS
jgi:hypothetical protein